MKRTNTTGGAVTIISGQQLSGVADLGGARLVGVVVPSAFTGVALTFQGSADGGLYNDVYNEGTLYSVTVGISRYVALNPNVFIGLNHVKVKSGSAEAADRVVTLVVDTAE